jgi:glutamate synthase (NADPH) large chain
MTGGMVAILGPVGDNFGAGMTGGMAFVYDSDDSFVHAVNPDTLVYQRLASAHWETVLKDLVAEHQRETQSKFAERLLVDWRLERARFWQVVPKETLATLAKPLADAPAAARA